MSRILKKSLSLLLALSMIFTVVSGLCLTASAAGTSVEIISFVRGSVNDLRSSELLEAKVTGYSGNVSDLTFTWSNNTKTYLYVYNSSNMYNIKDTAGEVEIAGDSSILGLGNKGETFSAQGYAWASVYGANLWFNSLSGSISVTVTDKDGNVLGTDSYSGFKSPSLKDDLQATNYGAFIGEKINLKDMLGRSSIVHIDCSACKVSDATTRSENINLTTENGEYIVEGLSRGVAEISLTISKENCKFHQNSGSKTITNKVYVFEKPHTSTATTTLTLTNLDANCEYFIGNVKGTPQGDSIVFTGLAPDTTYEVMVRGNYQSGYAYAYVTDTTKPVFRATVNFYTDNVLSNTLEWFGKGNNLFIKEAASTEYISLEHVATGVYCADVENGVYRLYYEQGGVYSGFGDFQLTIDNENNEVNIHTYSVRYDLSGGKMTESGSVYYVGNAVYATANVPTKEGYFFKHWKDSKGNTYTAKQLVTSSIASPIVLSAVWEKAIDVKVNVTIKHGSNEATPSEDVTFRLIEIANGASIPTDKVLTLSPESDGYEHNLSNNVTTYTAKEATFKDLKSAAYTVSCGKSNYELLSATATSGTGEDNVIEIVLEYAPTNFDLEFEVKMAENIPSSLYPAGVNVKVLYWGYDEQNNLDWHTIVQQRGSNAAVPVGIDKTTGRGVGSYPVWQVWVDNPEEPYYYSIEVVSYILDDGTIVTAQQNAFTHTVDIENGGGLPVYPAGSDVRGAYYLSGDQSGTPVATISIESYKLTFNANGGLINGADKYELNNQLIIPDTTAYVPAREGGYRFTGWYEDEACTKKVADGMRIYEDTIIYAGWKEPLSVSGTITVDAFYYQGNEKVEVLSVDRATTLVTTLQAFRNGTYNDVKSISKELKYDKTTDIATVEYSFVGLPDLLAEGEAYRIRAVLINYATSYDNNGDNEFKESEYTANFTENKKSAVVDAKLTFNADEYQQPYKVDATAIGEKYRPSEGITKILFQTTGSNPPNTVISQHTTAPYGEELVFSNGVAQGSVNLWKGISSGAMSNYQLSISSLDGEKYTEDSPYSVRYGSVTRWNAATGSADTLVATISPKEYIVNFNLNAGDDTIGNMEAYASEGGYFTTRKWSYDTQILAQPTREGYVFAGWECDDPDAFDGTSVSGDVTKDITLNAVWATFKWTTDTDAGYFMKDGDKKSVIRFLFDVDMNEQMRANIEETGKRETIPFLKR